MTETSLRELISSLDKKLSDGWSYTVFQFLHGGFAVNLYYLDMTVYVYRGDTLTWSEAHDAGNDMLKLARDGNYDKLLAQVMGQPWVPRR